LTDRVFPELKKTISAEAGTAILAKAQIDAMERKRFLKFMG
jgi:hypothetical protein